MPTQTIKQVYVYCTTKGKLLGGPYELDEAIRVAEEHQDAKGHTVGFQPATKHKMTRSSEAIPKDLLTLEELKKLVEEE